MAIYTLENNQWKAQISTFGAELISFVRKSDGREYIWDAKPEIWKRHAPVLFPLVGKYLNNTSYFEGKEYHMTQHGFARDMEFSVVCADSEYVKMSLCENETSLEKYPFKFCLSLIYKLSGNKLSVIWEVENTNNREMYFSIGGHPAFVGKGDSLTGAELVFETDEKELTFGLIGNDGAMGDDTDVLTLTDGKAKVTQDIFDRDALIFEHTDIKKVSLYEDGERIVSVSFDAPLFGIWSATKKNNPFVCIEPWFGRVDRYDFCGELSKREYGNTLAAGETFRAEHVIEFG